MATKKCHHCGVVDSTHRSDAGRSKLVEAVGPADRDGLQMWFVYCRGCRHMNIYKPGWIGALKHAYTWSSIEIMRLYTPIRMVAEQESVAGIPKNIQMEMLHRLDLALIEDQVI